MTIHQPLPTPARSEAEILGSGRYEVTTVLAGMTLTHRTDDLDYAERFLETFSRNYGADKQAQFGIYDFRMLRTVTSWRGGKPHGPIDLAHPMERMIRRARLAGQKTFVGTL